MTEQLDIQVELRRSEGFRLSIDESIALTGVTAVFGANGSGKTSLLRIIAGLEGTVDGSVKFRGTAWQGASTFVKPEDRGTGYVFQDGRLFPHLNVRDNLLFPARHGRRNASADFDEIAHRFELGSLMDRMPASLSGGERQRVAIARALLAKPEILLMDEPLSSVDLPRKRELLPLIHSLAKAPGIPIVYVTHDIDELVYLADSVILLADGQSVARGTPREILSRSDIVALAELHEPGAIIEAPISRQLDGLTCIDFSGNEIRIPHVDGNPGDAVRLRIQPKDVILALQPVSGISIRNCLPARVRRIDPIGDDQVLVELEVGEQLLQARITADAARELGLARGLSVYALIKTVALDRFA
jgi:molybdate transport system ATP-binding protein